MPRAARILAFFTRHVINDDVISSCIQVKSWSVGRSESEFRWLASGRTEVHSSCHRCHSTQHYCGSPLKKLAERSAPKKLASGLLVPLTHSSRSLAWPGLAPSTFLCRTYGAPANFASNSEVDTENVECVVIGAGVIGLAVARALALRGREVVVVEAASAIGTETSSRHSEVIHAGIYYPPSSLKARLCVEGKARLYDFCRKHHVPHKNITKLIVATSKEQLPDLESLRAAAARHGVPDLQLLGAAEARALEPALACEAALLSPSTGILDSHTYMQALLADAQTHEAVLALNTRVAGGWLEPAPVPVPAAGGTLGQADTSTSTSSTAAGLEASDRTTCTGPAAEAAGAVPYKVLELHSFAPASADGRAGAADTVGTNRPPPPSTSSPSAAAGPAAALVEVSRLRARWVVNAAGLHAMRLAASIAGLPRSSIPRLHMAKGNYFSLSGRSPFRRLIYPLPERGLAGLGTHLTLDMAGGARFGPDVEWLPDRGPDPGAPVAVDYRVDPRRAQSFYPAIRRFFPALPDGALQPAYSGVRPKLSGAGEPPADFMVQGACGGHGVRGWVNLYGIESPGLTSSLALAEYVCDMLEKS